MKRSIVKEVTMTALFISVPAMGGLPVSTAPVETTTSVVEKQPETKPTTPVEEKQPAAVVEKSPVVQETKVQPATAPLKKSMVREVPMRGLYLGIEYDYKDMTAENDFFGVESTTDYKSGPIGFLLGYTGNLGDIYGRYTLTDTEVDNYDGITEYGIGIRFHHPLKRGKTGFNVRVEMLFGDTDSDLGYSGALIGLGATTRASKSVILNYGIDYYSLNWDVPQTPGDGYYDSRDDTGFGIYLNMHLLFTR